MQEKEYISEVVKLKSPIDDRHTAKSWYEDFQYFIEYAKLLDVTKRQSFYAKKPTGDRLSKPLARLDALRTSPDSTVPTFNLASESHNADIVHAVLGVCTEAGELLEWLIKYLSNDNGEIEMTNFIEELGDLQWYIALAIYAANQKTGKDVSFSDVWQANINKLNKRYPTKSKEEFGADRNVVKEADEINKQIERNDNVKE